MNRLPRALARASRAPRLTPSVLPALAGLLAALASLGCGGEPQRDPHGQHPHRSAHHATHGEADPAATGTAPTPCYSPFVLDLRTTAPGALPFHLVSFKDVGMSLPDDASRQLVYESLAEALSLELAELATELEPSMTSTVRHDHRITDPEAHLACEMGHLYVDLWRSGDDGPYGYSLWSGCGEDDRFAYNERVSVTPGGAATAMDPLAEEIAESLEGALRRRCFQRAC